jgi:hypothetical protein
VGAKWDLKPVMLFKILEPIFQLLIRKGPRLLVRFDPILCAILKPLKVMDTCIIKQQVSILSINGELENSLRSKEKPTNEDR